MPFGPDVRQPPTTETSQMSILDDDPHHPNDRQGVIHSCLKCHTIFIPTRYWQRFCTPSCKATYNKRLIDGRPAADLQKPTTGDLA